MPILLIAGGLLVLAVIFGPQLWIRRVLVQHGDQRADFPGTGAELARHLLDAAGLQSVAVEETDKGDHYDPQARSYTMFATNIMRGGGIITVFLLGFFITRMIRRERARALNSAPRIRTGSSEPPVAPVVSDKGMVPAK